MKKMILFFAVLSFLLCSVPVSGVTVSGDTDAAVQQADILKIKGVLEGALKKLAQQDQAAAIRLMAEAIMHVRSSMPLKIDRILLCTDVRGFDDYDARPEFVLKAGEPLLLYMEPSGYGTRRIDGQYGVWISQDASIQNEKGEMIFQRNGWIKYRKSFSLPVMPLYLTNRISNIPKGSYTYTITLKDHHKNTFMSRTFKFRVNP